MLYFIGTGDNVGERMQAKEYRADIDVLRAIAVLAVIFYHAHIPFFRGGFVGVSIFFVISGYLITGIIKRKLADGTFSFLEFYENRVRRIFPALAVLMVFWGLLYYFLSMPEILGLQRSVRRALFGLANFFFYANTDYFDPAAETMPLLHTWSLGVEEQFYFVFPLLLFILNIYIYIKKPSGIKIVHILFALFLLSFIFSAVFVFYNQKFTFYMLPARAWELLCGSILAYTAWTPATQKGKSFCILSGLGIMFASIVLSGNVLFPGFWALPPCLGAVLYIAGGTSYAFSNRANIIHAVTNNKVLVFIGVISYSLYLWHWPVLVYYQNWLYRRDIDFAGGCVLLAVIFLVSVFSWRFIEKPVRQKPIFKKHGVLWLGVACSFALILLFINNLKFTLSFDDGFAYTKPELPAEYAADNSAHSILLIGDSHSGHLRPLMRELGEKYRVSSTNVNIMPYRTYTFDGSIADRKNIGKSFDGFREKTETTRFDTAVIAYRYDYYINGVDIPRKNSVARFSLKSLDFESEDPLEVLYFGLKETISLLRKNGVETIYLVGPAPQAAGYVPASANKLSGLFGLSTDRINGILGESAAAYQERTKEITALLKKLTGEFPHVYFLDPTPYLLNPQKTAYDVVRGKTALYWDDDHFSEEGALLLTPLFEPIFASLQE